MENYKMSVSMIYVRDICTMAMFVLAFKSEQIKDCACSE